MLLNLFRVVAGPEGFEPSTIPRTSPVHTRPSG